MLEIVNAYKMHGIIVFFELHVVFVDHVKIADDYNMNGKLVFFSGFEASEGQKH